MTYTGFVDVTGVNSVKIPALKAMEFILLYATGTDGIEATAAEIARFRSVGVSVGLIDQTPSLSVFASGIAHVAVADVESGAGTPSTVSAAVLERQARKELSTVYCSQNDLSTVKNALVAAKVDMVGVVFGVANYNLSRAEAEAALASNSDWAYVQYGDPTTNPNTMVPGSTVTLTEAQADIDVANSSWVAQFLPPINGPFRQVLHVGETIESFAQARDANTLNLFHRSVPLWTQNDIDLIVRGQMVVYTANA
jgi:hypothetical protein